MNANPGPLQLNDTQRHALLAGIHQGRVKELRGNSHLEAWDIRRTLIRVFGFGGFKVEYPSQGAVERIENNGRWTIVYTAICRLTVYGENGTHAVYEDGAAGDARNQPSPGDAYDLAMKSALSQALKRCAVNLGDQFGLSLYNDGSTRPAVVRTAVDPVVESTPSMADLPTEVADNTGDPTGEPAEGSGLTSAQTMAVMIGRARSEIQLHTLWESVKAARNDGRITEEEAVSLKNGIAARKTAVGATGTEAA